MTKLKLAFLASAVLMATNVQADWQGNFLLGVSAGGAWHNNTDDFFFMSFLSPTGFTSFAVNDDSDDSHFIWGLFAGYQARCDNWLAGLEVNVDWRGNNDDDVDFVLTDPAVTPIVGTVHRDRDPVIGITGRLGYNVLPCLMPYIRLGIDYSQREYELTATAPNIPAFGSFGVNSDNNKWGFVGGAGLEWFMPMIAGLSLRAEWDFHVRNDDNDDSAVIAVGATTVGISGFSHTHEQSARASLVYNF
ncbi:MAG: outer membrane beta-barrel protein [Proteobacteria bacterium]|nr:outer membrane beta-barrel protein [Pseudomonadota bacterium]